MRFALKLQYVTFIEKNNAFFMYLSKLTVCYEIICEKKN